MKRLPIGISDFKELIEGNYVYVDKTEYIHRLIKEGKYYFLSRPRRFGKSLLLSTIRYLFEGKRELFKGLYIEDKWSWEDIYPVIRIDFSEAQVRDEKELEKELKATVIELGKNYNYRYNKEYTISRNFSLLVKRCYENKKKKVVILIDEYDKVILDNIGNKEEVEKIRDLLKNFYGVLKGLDEYIRFVLVTGVSKFSKVSLFSGLNQLEDISLSKEYGDICGYTQEELENNFKEYLEGLDKEEIKEWYNGYNFLGDRLYNPFDILLYLKNRKLRNYWYETGKAEFLFKLIKERQYELPYLNRDYYTSEILDKFDIEYISIEALMYQSGYLTIKEVKEIEGEEMYILDYPNREVRQSFNRELLYYITGRRREDRISRLKIAIIEENIEEIRKQIEIFFSTISYEVLKSEYVYQAAVYGLIYSMGYNVIIEDNTSKGRIDLAVVVNRSIVYIIEFKVLNKEEEKGKAIKQIKEKEYFKKYMNYEKLYIIGIEIDKNKKEIVNFEYEKRI